MSKLRACGKITDIAKQTCVKKTNILVYEKPDVPPREELRAAHKPLICRPNPKTIKVCTGMDLKRMCPPVPCKCPVPEKSTFVRDLVMFIVKCALTTGAVYSTIFFGVWGNSNETRRLFYQICKTYFYDPMKPKKLPRISEACKEEFPLWEGIKEDCCEKFPFNTEASAYMWAQMWNGWIDDIFRKLSNYVKSHVKGGSPLPDTACTKPPKSCS